MKTADWQTPLHDLRRRLLDLWWKDLEVYHGVLLSLTRNKSELRNTISSLEPSHLGDGKMIHQIHVVDEPSLFHGHFFFGKKRDCYHHLELILDECRQAVCNIPEDVLPKCRPPNAMRRTDRAVLRWLAGVYHVGRIIDAPYLVEVHCESQDCAGKSTFFEWRDTAGTEGYDPLPMLVHHVDLDPLKATDSFIANDSRCPDVVDAYLSGGLVEKSLVTIDLLLGSLAWRERITGQRGQPPQPVEDLFARVVRLKRLLKQEHGPDWMTRPLGQPLDLKQIAKRFGWSGSTTTRTMKEIFGERPAKEYRKQFTVERTRGVRSRQNDGSVYADGVVNEDR